MAFGEDQIKFARKAADDSYDTVLAFVSDKIGKGVTSTSVAAIIAALVMCSSLLVTVVLGLVFRIGSQVAAIFLTTLEEVRHDNQDSLNTAIAAGMSDLLSVQVTGSDIPSGGDPQAQLDRARAIGAKLHELLETEFGGGNGPEGVDGRLAARAFTGFNINFNTGAAILSLLTEISSLGYFKEFREVGEMLAEGLSLGRLHRQALKPLVDALIVHPYTRQLGAKYRQARLSPEQYVRADTSGKLQTTSFHDHMAEAGYTDEDIAILQDLLQQKPGVGTLAQLERAGRITRDAANTILTTQGYALVDADGVMLSQQLGRDEGLQTAYIGEAYNLARDRHITESDFQGVLDSITMPESEKQLWAQRLSLHLLHPTKRISILQLAYLGERNQITDVEVDAWVTAEGYDDADAALIHLYVLGKELDYDAGLRKKSASSLAAKARRLKAVATAADKAVAAASKALAGATPDTQAQLDAALQAAEFKAQQAHAAYDAAQAAADAAANQSA